MDNAYEDKQRGYDPEYQDAYHHDDEVGGYAIGNPETGPPPPTDLTVQKPMPPLPRVQTMNQLGWFARIPIPLSIITSVSALWLVIASLLDLILESPSGADFLIDLYLIFFGFCLLLIVMPTAFSFVVFLERPRSGVEKWTRFITTHWGRGYFMLFVCILAFGRENFYRISVGIILILTGILSIWCGRLAAKKFNRLKEYLAAGYEGPELEKSIEILTANVFVDGTISESGLKALVEQSGRSVTPSEVHAIFCFFDRERHGKVELDDFKTILIETGTQKSL
jgi:hypothetical protein